MIEFVDLYTTDYNSSQITIWHTVIFFRLDTPPELFLIPTELRCTPLYSFSSLSALILFSTIYIISRRIHRKHRFLYFCIYSAVA
jgi:hypothetical protein